MRLFSETKEHPADQENRLGLSTEAELSLSERGRGYVGGQGKTRCAAASRNHPRHRRRAPWSGSRRWGRGGPASRSIRRGSSSAHARLKARCSASSFEVPRGWKQWPHPPSAAPCSARPEDARMAVDRPRAGGPGHHLGGRPSSKRLGRASTGTRRSPASSRPFRVSTLKDADIEGRRPSRGPPNGLAAVGTRGRRKSLARFGERRGSVEAWELKQSASPPRGGLISVRRPPDPGLIHQVEGQTGRVQTRIGPAPLRGWGTVLHRPAGPGGSFCRTKETPRPPRVPFNRPRGVAAGNWSRTAPNAPPMGIAGTFGPSFEGPPIASWRTPGTPPCCKFEGSDVGPAVGLPMAQVDSGARARTARGRPPPAVGPLPVWGFETRARLGPRVFPVRLPPPSRTTPRGGRANLSLAVPGGGPPGGPSGPRAVPGRRGNPSLESARHRRTNTAAPKAGRGVPGSSTNPARLPRPPTAPCGMPEGRGGDWTR